MRFARLAYGIAGIYGLVVTLPPLFLKPEGPAEIYYGFVGTALAWQVAFLVIAKDPARHRALMPATWIEKGVFGAAALALRTSTPLVLFGAIDLLLGAFFVEAWRRTKTT